MSKDRFELLLSLLLDDEITQEQLDELVALCKADSEKLSELRMHLEMSDRLLQYEMDSRSSSRFTNALESRVAAASEDDQFLARFTAHAEAVQQKEDSSQQSWRIWLTGVAVAAVAATLFFALPSLNFFPKPTDVETVTKNSELPETEVSGSTPETPETEDRGVAIVMQSIGLKGESASRLTKGTSLEPGPLAFEEGLIQIEFYSGASVILEGPAKVEIQSPLLMVCHSGKLRANIPEVAEGFTVKAPEIDVVDRGTEFAIEVASSGETEVHVIEGLVELRSPHDKTLEGEELTTGQAISVSDGKSEEIASREKDFAGAEQLQAAVNNRHRKVLKRWRELHTSISNDPRVIVYFDFERDQDNHRHGRSVLGYSGSGKEIRGAVVGCQWTEGRWPGKSALDFKRPGDRVRINLPGKYNSLTYSAWVRVDGLDRPFSSLLLTDEWNHDSPHWQLRGSGSLLLGIKHSGGSGGINYHSDSLIDLFTLGRWVHLVSVYDGKKNKVKHFVDGQLRNQIPVPSGVGSQMSIGKATIGNWVNPKPGVACKVRNFNGQIDELILFGDALTKDEIQQLYEAGKP